MSVSSISQSSSMSAFAQNYASQMQSSGSPFMTDMGGLAQTLPPVMPNGAGGLMGMNDPFGQAMNGTSCCDNGQSACGDPAQGIAKFCQDCLRALTELIGGAPGGNAANCANPLV